MKLIGNSRAIRSPEFHKKKERERYVRNTLLFLSFVLVIVAPIYLLRSEAFLISEIQVEGSNVTSEEEIQALAQARLEGSLLFFIPKSSSLLISRDAIRSDILEKFPRIESVDISLEGLKTLSISVVEREPSALYCENFSELDNPKDCYFLDRSGFIFDEAPEFSGDVYMIYATSPVLAEPLRGQYLPAEEFARLNTFLADLPLLNIVPKVLVREDDDYSVFLKSGTELKWKVKQDLQALLGDLEAFLRGSDIKGKAFESLLYLDLRIENKVFYRFKNE